MAWLRSDSHPCARGCPRQSAVTVGENLTRHQVILLLHLGLCSAGVLNPVCTFQFPEDLFKTPRTTSEFLGLGPSCLLQISPRRLSGRVRAASLHFRPRIPAATRTGNRLGRINNTHSQDGTQGSVSAHPGTGVVQKAAALGSYSVWMCLHLPREPYRLHP